MSAALLNRASILCSQVMRLHELGHDLGVIEALGICEPANFAPLIHQARLVIDSADRLKADIRRCLDRGEAATDMMPVIG